jgi:hypothetical protein
MNAPICTAPLAFDTLVEYWLDELEEAAGERVDEHVLGCDACAARLAEIVELGRAIRHAIEAGAVRAFLTTDFVQRLAERGVRVREYRIPPNGSVNCGVAPQDQLVVTHLEAPLQGVHRLDLVSQVEDHPPEIVRDIPFDAARGEVVIAPSVAKLRGAPPHRHRVRLIAVDGDGERLIGEYTFHHGALPGASG